MAWKKWLVVGTSAALWWLSGCGQLLGDVELQRDESGTLALSSEGPSEGSSEGTARGGSSAAAQPPAGAAGDGAAGRGGAGGLAGNGNVSLPLCDPGQSRCQGTRLERCSEAATWQLLDSCATSELCELSRAGGESACLLPACGAGERRCEGNRLLACNAGQTELSEEQLCTESERCDPRTGCDPLPCSPGERRCNGARIEVCDPQVGDFVPTDEPECASAQLCSESGAGPDNEVRCLEPVCPAAEFRCAGALLQRCSDGRNAWVDFSPCGSAELCNASRGPQGCAPAECEAGALSCAGDTLLSCRPGRDGQDVVAECARAGGCDPRALACADPCIVGGARCNGAFLETCEDVLTGWQRTECASAALCDAAARTCRTPGCDPSERGCRGAQPQRCAPGRDGFVDVGPACASAALCDPEAGACIEPACEAGETRCDGLDELLTCNADQTGFDPSRCTGLLALCDDGPPARCRSLL